MIRKGAKDGVIVDHTNLHNEFFVPTKQGNKNITVARLPYFDGDYWTGAAESIIEELEEEETSEGLPSKLPIKQVLKAMGRDFAKKDALVMQKVYSFNFFLLYINNILFFFITIVSFWQLGETILPLKENFMIVRLQHACTYCHELILSGSRWFCNQCNKIQLCSR